MSAAPDDGVDVSEVVPSLRVRDRAWPCRDQINFWLVAKASVLERKGAHDAEMLPLLYELAMNVVEADHRENLDAYLGSLDDLTRTEVGEAITRAMGEMSGSLPKGSPTPSSDGPSSPATPSSSRVVSFSRGTVEEVPIDSTPSTSSTD